MVYMEFLCKMHNISTRKPGNGEQNESKFVREKTNSRKKKKNLIRLLNIRKTIFLHRGINFGDYGEILPIFGACQIKINRPGRMYL